MQAFAVHPLERHCAREEIVERPTDEIKREIALQDELLRDGAKQKDEAQKKGAFRAIQGVQDQFVSLGIVFQKGAVFPLERFVQYTDPVHQKGRNPRAQAVFHVVYLDEEGERKPDALRERNGKAVEPPGGVIRGGSAGVRKERGAISEVKASVL